MPARLPLPPPAPACSPFSRATGALARRSQRAGRARLGALAAACFAAGAVVVLPATARADDAEEFAIGKNRFDAGQYEEAAKRFAAMLDEKAPLCSKTKSTPEAGCRLGDPDLTERARAFSAASLVALNKPAEADAQIERLLRANPAYAPSPATFPPDVLDRFSAVRGRLRKELELIARQKAEKERAERLKAQAAADAERNRVLALEKLAQEERIPNSRLVAMLPFGVGQFQNGKPALGAFFLVSQVLAGGTSIVLGAIHGSQATIEPDTPPGGEAVDTKALETQLQQLAFANQIAFGTWAALTVAGIAEAQISFVPVKVKKRRLPPSLRASPQVGLGPTGATFGLRGTF